MTVLTDDNGLFRGKEEADWLIRHDSARREPTLFTASPQTRPGLKDSDWQQRGTIHDKII